MIFRRAAVVFGLALILAGVTEGRAAGFLRRSELHELDPGPGNCCCSHSGIMLLWG
jgi:hypothetical protein